MSNPNVVNLNNLDGRYATTANITSAVAAQAATDAGQYVTYNGNNLLKAGSPISISSNEPYFVFTQSNIGGVGDGVTDNTSAWNAAMNLLETAGGTLFFPAGVYCISGTTQTVPGGSMLAGTGIDYGPTAGATASTIPPVRASVIRATASMARLISLGRNPSSSDQVDTGASMRDLIVDGANLATATVRTAGRRNYIYNSQIWQGASYGVDFAGQNSYLIGGVVSQNSVGICVNIASGTDHKVFDSQMRTPGTTGSCIYINVGDVLVSRNHIYTVSSGSTATASALIEVGPAALIVGITDNIIEGVSGPEIKINSGARGVTVTSNRFFNTTSSVDGQWPVITLNATANGATLNDIVIVGNTALGQSDTHKYKSFVEFVGTFGNTERIIASGNNLLDVAALTSGTTPPNAINWGQNTQWNGTSSVKTENQGSATFTGDGSTTTFNIAHGLSTTPAYVHAQPASTAATTAGISSIAVTSTAIAVTFITAPASGAGNTVLYWSAKVSGIATSTGAADITAPTVPGTPTATAQAGSIALSWTASTDATGVTGYHVYRSDAPSTFIGTSSSNSYTDTTAVVGTAYTYTVDAYDAAGNVSAKSSSSNSVAATAGSSNFISDSFSGTTGVNLTAHTGETGATWTKVNTSASAGSMSISTANRSVSNGTANAVYFASGTPASADYTVEADVYFASFVASTSDGIILRGNAADTGTGYIMRYVVSTNIWRIDRFTSSAGWSASTATVASSAATTIAAGETHHIKLVASGSTLTGYVDGAQVASGTDANITTAGGAGLYHSGGTAYTSSTGLHFDNFVAHP